MSYSETMKPLGDKVLLKKLVPTLDKKYGDILLPQSNNKNGSLGVAQVIDLGSDAEKMGLKKNDYVLYDYFSVYHNNQEFVITRVENVFLSLTEEEANDYANNYVITV